MNLGQNTKNDCQNQKNDSHTYKITVMNEKNDSHSAFITVMTVIKVSSANMRKPATKLALTK